jgi:hypothetical protein
MYFELLIDNIVRQTTVLIAQLATAAGGRAPLSQVAGQVFLSLVQELKDQGLGNKVIADMFGLALRTYHNRVRRYSESATDRGVSLWAAVLSYIQERDVVMRSELMTRFHADEEEMLRGVLKDLVESGLLYRSGRGDQTSFRAAQPGEAQGAPVDSTPAAANLIWVTLHQRGALAPDELMNLLGLKAEVVEAALASLTAEGRVDPVPATAGPEVVETALASLTAEGHVDPVPATTGPDSKPDPVRYQADHCVIPYGDEHGWEAALFDHYQAVVTAIAAKVGRGATRARQGETSGGSTYHFDLFTGHPLEHEVLGFLSKVRREASDLRQRVNASRLTQLEQSYRVVFYAGQNVVGREEGEETTE